MSLRNALKKVILSQLERVIKPEGWFILRD